MLACNLKAAKGVNYLSTLLPLATGTCRSFFNLKRIGEQSQNIARKNLQTVLKRTPKVAEAQPPSFRNDCFDASATKSNTTTADHLVDADADYAFNASGGFATDQTF